MSRAGVRPAILVVLLAVAFVSGVGEAVAQVDKDFRSRLERLDALPTEKRDQLFEAFSKSLTTSPGCGHLAPGSGGNTSLMAFASIAPAGNSPNSCSKMIEKVVNDGSPTYPACPSNDCAAPVSCVPDPISAERNAVLGMLAKAPTVTRAVGLLRAKSAAGAITYKGNIVHLGNGLFVTNAHVASADGLSIPDTGAVGAVDTRYLQDSADIQFDRFVDEANATPYTITLPDLTKFVVSKTDDLAMFRIPGTTKPASIAFAAKAGAANDSIVVIGNPGVAAPSETARVYRTCASPDHDVVNVIRLSYGHIASVKGDTFNDNANTLPGNSGSAVVDLDGRLVGIHANGTEEGIPYNGAVSLAAVIRLQALALPLLQ